MVDVHTKEQRSYNMSQIKSKGTIPELVIRKSLHHLGYRYSLNSRKLAGHPDIVLPKYKTVIFINGCFWHYHQCHLFKMPETRFEWWKEKFCKTRLRDKKNVDLLLSIGWRVMVVWECAFKQKRKIEAKRVLQVVEFIDAWLKSNQVYYELKGER